MRLTHIKICGFKSFVDPTTLKLMSHLTAVVGPNGCGKSNLIDAVRWVLGESSAKNLRGEALIDVIFDGSSSRKPSSQASVELVFDNSQNRLGGEFKQYNELSVKRSVTRDGLSFYSLNGTRCRRKDITHIFLGTGLGARSYSIVEQGMISKFVEAKPDDLRTFLEEAAGISKYKERRHETLLRIKKTDENLFQINSLKEEVGKQLKKLKQQAENAERYKTLKAEQRVLKNQLLAIKWQELSQSMAQTQAKINLSTDELKAQNNTKLTFAAALDEQLATKRLLDEKYSAYCDDRHSIHTTIAKLEQTIAYKQAQISDLNQSYQQVLQEAQVAKARLEQDREMLKAHQVKLMELAPEAGARQTKLNEAERALRHLEQIRHDWQAQLQTLQTKLAQCERIVSVEAVRKQGLQARVQAVDDRLIAIDQALLKCNDELEQKWLAYDQQLQAKAHALEEVRQLVTKKAATVHELQQHVQHQQISVQAQQGMLQALDVELAGLKAQQHLQRTEPDIAHWLATSDLKSAPVLVEQLQVAAGFELAVETVCAHYLQAFCVPALPEAEHLETLAAGQISCMETVIDHQAFAADTLLSKLTPLYQAMTQLWSTIYVADDVPCALAKLAQLPKQASVVTKTGVWLGHGWQYVHKIASETQTVIERQSQIDALMAELAEAKIHLNQKQTEITDLHQSLLNAQVQLESAKQQLQLTEQDYAECKLQAHLQKERWTHQQQAVQSMKHEQEQLHQQHQQLCEEIERSDQVHAKTAMEQMGLQAEQTTLNQRRTELEASLQKARESAEQAKIAVQEVAVKQQIVQTEYKSLEQTLARATEYLTQLLARQETLSASLAQTESPEALQAQLEAEGERRTMLEKAVAEVQQALADCQQTHAYHEAQYAKAQEAVRQTEQTLQHLQLELEKDRVRSQAIAEQLTHTEMTMDAIVASLPAQADPTSWMGRIETIETKLNRLGAINLAAIDEFTEESKRMDYLEQQTEDLLTALKTLQQAIAKIDLETKEKFKLTYDQVNTNFQHLFPVLFNGGRGLLQLTSEDLLETGVLIMARPPGKKTTHIRSLSGGEKALTAIALILAIFQLNPSPFCLLDEVDAPLDDANVARFCRVIKEMANDVQFIFITHNKITMQLAQQLTGVTMSEPGVSRLVAVDMETALAQANA